MAKWDLTAGEMYERIEGEDLSYAYQTQFGWL